MFWTKFNESTRTVLYSLSCLSIVAIVLWFGATLNTSSANSDKSDNTVPSAVFPANPTTLGSIPDNAPTTPLDVTFTVSGLSGTPSNISTNITFGGPGLAVGHTFVGDVDVTLIAPNGTTSHVIFAGTGTTSPTAFGDSSDLVGPYNFTDTAAGVNWWQAAATAGLTEAIPSGDYRTTQAGPQTTTTNSPATDLTAAFSGVSDPNGTWTLRFTDNANLDTGAVMAANLTIETGPGGTNARKNDFDGDGKSDYVVVRNPAGGLTSDIKMNNEFRQSAEQDLKIKFLKPLRRKITGQALLWSIYNSGDNSARVQGFGQSTLTRFLCSGGL